jgi:uncharacterized protein
MKHLHAHSPLRIFGFAVILSIITCLLIGLMSGLEALFAVLVLAVIEITFSFENAVVNAKVLSRMGPKWQIIFLTAGIAVAVFGMRMLLPLLLVSTTAHLGISDVLSLALHHPHEYAEKLENAHVVIAAFGGSFLLMVFLHFMFESRSVHWIDRIEQPLRRLETMWIGPLLIALSTLCAACLIFAGDKFESAVIAGLIGLGVYSIIKLVSDRFQGGGSTLHAGLFGFIYLELLDASFSFDGVVAAFAITKNVILIAAGLGIGALYVRSLTVYLLRKGTLTRYIYLEHGAYYAVGALAAMLLLSIGYEIPSFITGIIGVSIIGLALQSSRRYNHTALQQENARRP